MSEKAQKKDRYAIHLFVTLIIMAVFRFIPPPGSVTSYGMAILGVFIGLIYGWTFIGLLIPSLFGAVHVGDDRLWECRTGIYCHV